MPLRLISAAIYVAAVPLNSDEVHFLLVPFDILIALRLVITPGESTEGVHDVDVVNVTLVPTQKLLRVKRRGRRAQLKIFFVQTVAAPTFKRRSAVVIKSDATSPM